MRLGSTHIDLDRLTVEGPQGTCSLTPTEGKLLAFLAEHPAHACDRRTLLREVWGYADSVRSRAVDATVQRLRYKIEPDPSRPRLLLTIRGIGFELVVPEQEAPVRQPAASNPIGRQVSRPPSKPMVGRTEVIDVCIEALSAGRLVTLTGPGGIGKSAVALHILDQWDDGQRSAFFIDLSNADTLQGVIATTANIVGASRNDLMDRLATLSAPLLVLDHLTHLTPEIRNEIDVWSTVAAVLITGSHPLGTDNEVLRPLGPLTREDSNILLDQLAQAHGYTHTAADLSRAFEAVGGLPLGLEIVGPMLGLLRGVEVSALELEASQSGPTRHRTLEQAMEASWKGLHADSRDLLSQMTVFTAGFSGDAISQISSLGGSQLMRHLKDLRERGLLLTAATEMRLPRAVRAFAVRHADPAVLARADQSLDAWLSGVIQSILEQGAAPYRRYRADIVRALGRDDGSNLPMLASALVEVLQYTTYAPASVTALRAAWRGAPPGPTRVALASLTYELLMSFDQPISSTLVSELEMEAQREAPEFSAVVLLAHHLRSRDPARFLPLLDKAKQARERASLQSRLRMGPLLVRLLPGTREATELAAELEDEAATHGNATLPILHNIVGQRLMMEGDLPVALRTFHKAMQGPALPGQNIASLWSAIIQARLGQPEAADEQLAQVVETLCETRIEEGMRAQVYRAVMHLGMARSDSALTLARHALAVLYPLDPQGGYASVAALVVDILEPAKTLDPRLHAPWVKSVAEAVRAGEVLPEPTTAGQHFTLWAVRRHLSP